MGAIHFAYTNMWYPKALQTQRKPWRTQRELWRTQHEPIEYSVRWVCKGWVYNGHVDFMLFVACLFELGTKRKCFFCWNTGFNAWIFLSTPVIYYYNRPYTLLPDIWITSSEQILGFRLLEFTMFFILLVNSDSF